MNFQDISIQWRNQNEHIHNMSLPISLDQFGLDHLQRSLAFEFKILTFMTQTQHHLEKLYQNPQQFPYNRNPHIMTFKPTKPLLSNQEDKDKIQNYINANLIDFKGKYAIATQGPLNSTFYNLFRMIEQYKVTSIFMLCCLIEKNKKKCDRYWPNMQTQGGKMIEKQYQITILEEKKINDVKIRKLKIKNHHNNFQTVLMHYHVLNWPDGERPLNKSKKDLTFLLKQFLKNIEKGQPPIVHCSAGVGRTGTFIAMGLFKKIIDQENQVSVFETVRQLREQRWGMVYTFSQYEFLYDFVEEEIKKKRDKENGIQSDEEQQTNQGEIHENQGQSMQAEQHQVLSQQNY